MRKLGSKQKPMSRALSGMRGVFLTAAELAGRGLTVSPTARNAKGADLLVTTDNNRRAYSVEVKCKRDARHSWLMKPEARDNRSRSHVYVFVNDHAKPPEFFVVPSRTVAVRLRDPKNIRGTKSMHHIRLA